MAIKTNGLEFMKFYADEKFWPLGTFHEDEIVTVNGVQTPEGQDYEELNIKDTDMITISDGIVYNDTTTGNNSFEGYFKKWKKKQKHVYVVVEVFKEKLEEFKNTIAGTHSRIVS